MELTFGTRVRIAREALGFDQAALASALDVGQQTVSKWERDKSRPRRPLVVRLADVLDIPVRELEQAAGHLPSPDAETPVPAPVRPLTRTLPVNELPEERFEDLTADLMGYRYPEGHASRFGGRGHTQDGIDVLVAGATAGHNLATAQCKRHRDFGPAMVAEAIGEATVTADRHYLFLSRLTASPAARKEAAKHPDWELWDGEDISRYIRSLPDDIRVRVVDTYFPGHRAAFLGIDSPGPWLDPEAYFDLASGTLFTQDWQLVGRTSELDDLADKAYGAGPSLSVITGHGGLGKTRLLKALSSHQLAAGDGPRGPQSAHVVKVLPGAADVTPADLELLPTSPGVTILVDDAHEASDLSGVVRSIWNRNGKANIVVATRPYGRDVLLQSLRRHSLLPETGARVELSDLDPDDAESLAREALGPEASAGTVARLAALTTDSPITTVVGGSLIRRGQLDPSALEQDAGVRDAIMRGFVEALVSDPLAEDPSTRRSVLEAVAAIQPFRTSDTAARDSIAAIVGQPYDKVNRHLRNLENAGVLRRRGSSLRIMPDLLGDVLLADAAYDEHDPLGTGYLARIEPLVDGPSAENLFINVSRVDWQIKQRRADSHSLTDSLWAVLASRLESADIAGRVALVELLAKVAYFQPTRALQATRWLMDHPTEATPEGRAVRALLRPFSYEEVLHALPSAHARAALDMDSLNEAITQLWELAQTDERPTNQHPNHPLRVLCDIAEIRPGKPVAYLDAIIDMAQTWYADKAPVSPFDVLDPLLATEGSTSRLRHHTITFEPFALDAASVRPLRARVIDLAFTELASTDLGRAARAAETIETAMRPPIGTYGRDVTGEERDLWTPEVMDTIARLRQVVASGGLDPAVYVAIRRCLHWHASYSTSETGPAARTVLASIPADVETSLALALHDGWGHLIRDDDDDYEAIEAKRLTMFEDTVRDLTAQVPPDDVVTMIVARLQADVAAFGPRESHAGPMLDALTTARPDLAPTFVAAIRSGRASALEPWLGVVLGQYATADTNAALEAARDILASGQQTLRHGVASALAGRRGRRALAPGELDLLLMLATDPDPEMRRGAVRAAQSLARSDDRASAVKLLAAVRFADSPQLAEELFMSFHRQVGITWDDFSAPQVELIRDDLVEVDDIGEHSTWTAIIAKSHTDPEWVITLLQSRGEHAETLTHETYGYRALPYRPHPPLRIDKTPQFKDALTYLLTWIAGNADLWRLRDAGAELFAAVAGTFDPDVVNVLTAAVTDGLTASPGAGSAEPSGQDADATQADRAMDAVIAVLAKAPRTFIWDHPEFVATALREASQRGPETLKELRGAFYGATISGVRTGTPGKPFAEDIEQRDRSTAIADTLPHGSPERQLYLDMAKAADRDIERALDNDLGDGRDW